MLHESASLRRGLVVPCFIDAKTAMSTRCVLSLSLGSHTPQQHSISITDWSFIDIRDNRQSARVVSVSHPQQHWAVLLYCLDPGLPH